MSNDDTRPAPTEAEHVANCGLCRDDGYRCSYATSRWRVPFDPHTNLPGEYDTGRIVRAAVDYDPDKKRMYLKCSVGELAHRLCREVATLSTRAAVPAEVERRIAAIEGDYDTACADGDDDPIWHVAHDAIALLRQIVPAAAPAPADPEPRESISALYMADYAHEFDGSEDARERAADRERNSLEMHRWISAYLKQHHGEIYENALAAYADKLVESR